MDELKVHSNEDGQLDKTRTDAYLHFVNAKDNSVMEVDVVLRLIDANIESLDQLFKVLCLVLLCKHLVGHSRNFFRITMYLIHRQRNRLEMH